MHFKYATIFVCLHVQIPSRYFIVLFVWPKAVSSIADNYLARLNSFAKSLLFFSSSLFVRPPYNTIKFIFCKDALSILAVTLRPATSHSVTDDRQADNHKNAHMDKF